MVAIRHEPFLFQGQGGGGMGTAFGAATVGTLDDIEMVRHGRRSHLHKSFNLNRIESRHL